MLRGVRYKDFHTDNYRYTEIPNETAIAKYRTIPIYQTILNYQYTEIPKTNSEFYRITELIILSDIEVLTDVGLYT